ncbi:MAG TPA: tRNA uridine-5-carboxymethylaminomethyl(34) synthesis GTPase MnmE [Methylomirabilota bacterium]|nr:tRNA uridine-5-carboxymethylaminomethyl(34) synthesis GTPase MnmE [Methylomirabilota bacterium]
MLTPLDDTIAAIATPLGEGALAVIRLSGKEALAIADKVFVPAGKSSLKISAAPTHTLQYGHVAQNGRTIDEVLAAVMRAPRTFTREDVVEFTCHGGVLTAKMVLDAALASGARMAEPGEFTKRAFLNGRIDLTQAEAVADLIAARTELAVSAANEQLAGKLSQRINEVRDQMMLTLAHIEAHIDFPDEDIAPDTHEQLLDRLRHAVAFMDELLRTANEGQVLRRGIRAAIIGRPNAGKSSLLNQLLGHDRAIVSAIPGTTRDTIEETANIRGIPVVFIDTAGLREGTDEIEVEGIKRSRTSLERAELILHVLDLSEPLTEADGSYLREFAAKKRIIVQNKSDLPRRLDLPPLDAPCVPVSCTSGAGLESLKDAIKNLVWSGEIRADMLQVMINSRHQDALRRAKEATENTIAALNAGQSLEIAAMELRIATNAIGEVVGKTTTEDLLDSIFSQFCLGK